jgi:hypothetical protein
MSEKEDQRRLAFRELAREQGELYISCYMEALRVVEGIESIDAQNQVDRSGPSVSRESDTRETAEFEDGDAQDDDGEISGDFAVGIASELFREAASRLRQIGGVAIQGEQRDGKDAIAALPDGPLVASKRHSQK